MIAQENRHAARAAGSQEAPDLNAVTAFDCDVCGCGDAIEVPHSREYTKDSVPVHICSRCGLVYTRQRRSAQAIADSWSHDIYGDGYTARIPAVRARQVYVADTIDVELGLRGKSLCDIGGGEGQFLEMARDDYGASVFTTEASAENCFRLRLNGIAHYQGTVEDFSETASEVARRFDIASIMWTLECCRSPRTMLEAAHKILKPGGHLVVATGSRILVPFKKPLNLFFSSERERDTHPIEFSANTLQGFMQSSRFEPVFVNRYLDSDVLLVIAKKVTQTSTVDLAADDPTEVSRFFERWHLETQNYIDR